MSRRSKLTTGKYALIGMVVSKVVLPAVKKHVKKRARNAVKSKAASGANAVKSHPATTGIAIGALFGAASYVAKRVYSGHHHPGGHT